LVPGRPGRPRRRGRGRRRHAPAEAPTLTARPETAEARPGFRARLAFAAAPALVVLLALALACDGDGDGAGVTPEPHGGATESPAQTATALPDLRLLFYSDRGGNDDVYSAPLDGGGDIRRLTDDPGRDYEADASPDGSALVFASERSGQPGSQLYLMDPDGTNVRRLTFSAREGAVVVDDYAHWAHDGRRIVFQRTTIPAGGSPDADIWLIDAESGEEAQLTNTPEDWDSTPAFSPHADSVLFESDRGGDYDVYRLDVPTLAVTRLVAHEASELQVKESPADGSLLFISNRDGDYEVFVANPDGSDPRQLTTNEADDRYPHWSPDGTQILFNSDSGGDQEVYVMDADGSGVRRITNDPGRDADPHWARID
jgi:TolB protein